MTSAPTAASYPAPLPYLQPIAHVVVFSPPLPPVRRPQSQPVPLVATHTQTYMVTLSATATLLSPLQLRPQQRPSSVHTDAISGKTVTVTPFAIARVQRKASHALSDATMSPTTMATLIANVPLHGPPHPFLSPVPTVVHQTQISGARHTADVILHDLLPLPSTLQLHPATLRVVTNTTSTGVRIDRKSVV